MPTATDQEIIVYGGYYLKSLGDVSNLQPTSMLIANASRLTEIECHSPNLINTDLSECTKLQRIDLSDCTALGTGIGAQPILNIQNCKYLRYCNCMNTQLTAIYTMQAGGNLEEIYFPETTQVIQATNQTHLKVLGIPYGYKSELDYIKYKPTFGYRYGSYPYDKPNTMIEGDYSCFAFEDFIPIEPNTTYYIGLGEKLEYFDGWGTPNGTYAYAYTYCYDENFNRTDTNNGTHHIGWMWNNHNQIPYATFTTPSNAKYVKVSLQLGGDYAKYHQYCSMPTIEDVLKNFVLVKEEEYGTYAIPKNLANVQISNCNKIDYIQYPYIEGDILRFDSLKYVQNLTITNSLDRLTEMKFGGFSKLRTVNLSSMKYITKLGFDDMLPAAETSTLKTITISDCPLIVTVSFNVSSNDYKVAFAKGGTVDIGGMQSVKTIESNASIKGLDTLIMPTGLEYLKFSTEYGDGVNEIKNLWSASSVHKDDGFQGIDLLDMELKHIDMLGLSQVENAINFNIAPIDQHPNMNTARDGSDSKPWFRPTGSINLNKYNGDMTGLLKGLDLNKMEVILEVDKPNTNLTSLFESTIFSNNEKIVDILSKFKNADTYKYIFKNSSLTDASEIEFNDTKLNLEGAFMNSKITADINLPIKTINAIDCFRDCKELTSITNNWDKKYSYEIVSDNCYTGCSNVDLDEVPKDWGGFGFFKEYTSIYELEIPTDNYTVKFLYSLDDGAVRWGDDSDITYGINQHTYKYAGTYQVKGKVLPHNSVGMADESLRKTLIKVLQTSNHINLSARNMFWNCEKLRYVDMSNTKFAYNSLNNFFWNCYALEEVKMDNCDFSKVTNLDGMFSECRNLHYVDVSKINVTQTVSCDSMFNGTTNLVIDGLPQINWTINNMNSMFKNNKIITEVDLSNCTLWYSNGGCASAFEGCTNLERAIGFNTQMPIEQMGYIQNTYSAIFANCTKLTYADGITFGTDSNAWGVQFYNYAGGTLNNIPDNGLTIKFYGIIGQAASNMSAYVGGHFWRCLSPQSLVNLLECLMDLSGTENAFTLNTFGYISKLTDEQKAIALNKGWNLA